MMNQSALLKFSLLLLLVCGTDAKMKIITSKHDVEVGQEVLLLCKAGTEGDMVWQKDGIDITEEEKVSKTDEVSSKLFIKSATIHDTGRYTCMSEDNEDDKDEMQLNVFESPSFSGTKTYHEFLEGTEGAVPCLVTSKEAVDVSWSRDKEQITSISPGFQLIDSTLYIEKVKRGDAGTYECQAQIRGKPIYKRISVTVVVNAPPKVHLKEKEKKVMAGSDTDVSLFCLVDGLPEPEITWILPMKFDPSHHQLRSNSTQLTIHGITRGDDGYYVCTARNKIAEDNATITLHVFESPEVFVSAKQLNVSVGEQISVSCNVSGHPHPQLHWLNKHKGQTLDSTSGRIRVVDGKLMIDYMMPSDGGLYSCMAVGASGNASTDVAIYTEPGPPDSLSVSPGPTSIFFSLKIQPVSGGTPITSFFLQWRQSVKEQWKEITVPASGPLSIATLKPYTVYIVRLAALNAVGVGQFSNTSSVRTLGIREPDSPILSSDKIKVESNSFSVPLKQTDDGGMPLLHYRVRYRLDAEGAQWKEMQLPSNADSVSLQDLSYRSNYQLEVTAYNANGSSIPATLDFTIAEQLTNRIMTKGSVIGIVIIIFLVVFLVVDATCCYRNRCGLLMTIGVKLFGQKVPGLKMLDDEVGATNGDVKLKGIPTPRSSMQWGVTKDGEQLREVTCDKAPPH